MSDDRHQDEGSDDRYEHDYDDGGEPRDLKAEELELDAQDEQRRAEQAAAAGEDDECPGAGYAFGEPEHCGNDCGGRPIRDDDGDDTGEWDEPVDCVHCECCTCTSCSYARHA